MTVKFPYFISYCLFSTLSRLESEYYRILDFDNDAASSEKRIKFIIVRLEEFSPKSGWPVADRLC